MGSSEKSPMVSLEENGNSSGVKFLPNGLEDSFDSNKKVRIGVPSKWWYYKQVLAVGFGWMFIFMALVTLRNLQSSLNHVDGLGLIAMGTFYGGMMIGSFVSSAIVQTLGPKMTLVISASFHVLFVAANFYPNLPLMVTIGAVAGVSHSMLWAAQSTYLTALAKSFSQKFRGSYEHLLARVFGVTFLFTESAAIIGHPLASFLLGFESSLKTTNNSLSENLGIVLPNNFSDGDIDDYVLLNPSTLYTNTTPDLMLCGRHYCHAYKSDNSKMQITTWTRYLVVGVFTASAALALVIFISGIKDRHVYERKPGCSDLGDKLLGTLKSIVDIKMLLCIPWMIFFGFQMAFVSGDVVKAYVTCPVGIRQVGNLMLFYGILNAISSPVAGWMKKFLGSVVMFTVIVCLNAAVFIALLVWVPDGSIWGYVLFAALGCIQGLTNIHINSQVGFIFRDSVESAYSAYRLFLGLGLSVGFIYSPHFCMEVKIWVTVTLFSLAAVCYYALEAVIGRSLRLQLIQNEKTVDISVT